jgi:hypothetical protein
MCQVKNKLIIDARIFSCGEVSFAKFLFLPSWFVKLFKADFSCFAKNYMDAKLVAGDEPLIPIVLSEFPPSSSRISLIYQSLQLSTHIFCKKDVASLDIAMNNWWVTMIMENWRW